MLYGIAAGSISMSGCPTSVEVYEAFWIGLIGGALYSLFTKVLTHKCGIDDPLEGTSYHFICGLWGTICTGFFEEREGIFHEGDGTLLGLQIVAVLVIIAWGAVFGGLLFGLLALTKQLRMPEEVEVLGLAYAEVGLTGYKLKSEYVPDSAAPSTGQTQVLTTRGKDDSPDIVETKGAKD
jgi:Amt family ammonium transporter